MRTARLAAIFAAAAVLAACGKETSAPPAAPAAPAAATTTAAAAPAATTPASAPAADSGKVSIDTILAETKSFTVGSAMSVRTVYIFFDAQCPHCGALWYAAKPLKSQAKFVWIPVRLLNDNSESQGAALLAAKDPVQAMDDHEASMMDRKGGIKPEGDVAAQRAAVKKNTELFTRYAFGAVPTLVTKNSKTGEVVTHEGSFQTPDLAAFLGVAVPTQ